MNYRGYSFERLKLKDDVAYVKRTIIGMNNHKYVHVNISLTESVKEILDRVNNKIGLWQVNEPIGI